MTNRQSNESLQAELQKYKDAEKEAKRKDMTELQKAQDDLKTASDNLAKTQKELAASLARADFLEAGVSDIDSVTALWAQMSDDEKAGQKPKEWAEALKTQKSHLFKSADQNQQNNGFGGNHRNDGGAQGNQGGQAFVTHPTSLKEINQVYEDFDKMFSN